MQKKDSMFYDSPYVSFAVETSDSLDGANDYTIFYDKKRKQAYIYSETETRYMVLQRDYADCDKTQLANMLLKDLSENKYKVDKNWAGDGNTAVVTARAVTVTYRRGFAAYGKQIMIKNYLFN